MSSIKTQAVCFCYMNGLNKGLNGTLLTYHIVRCIAFGVELHSICASTRGEFYHSGNGIDEDTDPYTT